jgi:hypothetical protein
MEIILQIIINALPWMQANFEKEKASFMKKELDEMKKLFIDISALDSEEKAIKWLESEEAKEMKAGGNLSRKIQISFILVKYKIAQKKVSQLVDFFL